ncbi:hypothetical protein Fcan01_19284 [Folsomia candida]|uniref:Uncharacterized protein n=1 Tax=Folsomia candida TaxID=158441 RepID=A0A226DKZ1_FOLCA|nr:hypothetical protein Fcan01_19284 [Folsomia candida]
MLALMAFLGQKLDSGYYFIHALFPKSGWEVIFPGKLMRCIFTLVSGYHMFIGAISIVLSAFEIIALATDCAKAVLHNNRSLRSRADYGALSILINRGNKIARWTLAVSSVLASGTFIFSMAAVIKYYGKIDVLTYLVFVMFVFTMIIFMATVVPFAAKLNIVSTQFVEEWGKRIPLWGNKRVLKHHVRCARAMKPIGIECSGIGIVGKLTLVEIYEGWLDRTITVVLGLDW